VKIGGFGGLISAVPPNPNWVFAGPVTTLTTTATQSIVVSGSAALGTSGATVLAAVGVCVSPTGASSPAPLDPGSFTEVKITSTRSSDAASATGAPGAGTWDVGMCVNNGIGTDAINDNDWSVGYAFVANGTPVSEAPALSRTGTVRQAGE
jgi:hypothetical protein